MQHLWHSDVSAAAKSNLAQDECCMTNAGPDGQLPESVQKVEPAILELVCNEVVESGGRVVWDDISGQEQAKRLIQELVVWPMKNPNLFKV